MPAVVRGVLGCLGQQRHLLKVKGPSFSPTPPLLGGGGGLVVNTCKQYRLAHENTLLFKEILGLKFPFQERENRNYPLLKSLSPPFPSIENMILLKTLKQETLVGLVHSLKSILAYPKLSYAIPQGRRRPGLHSQLDSTTLKVPAQSVKK